MNVKCNRYMRSHIFIPSACRPCQKECSFNFVEYFRQVSSIERLFTQHHYSSETIKFLYTVIFVTRLHWQFLLLLVTNANLDRGENAAVCLVRCCLN